MFGGDREYLQGFVSELYRSAVHVEAITERLFTVELEQSVIGDDQLIVIWERLLVKEGPLTESLDTIGVSFIEFKLFEVWNVEIRSLPDFFSIDGISEQVRLFLVQVLIPGISVVEDAGQKDEV